LNSLKEIDEEIRTTTFELYQALKVKHKVQERLRELWKKRDKLANETDDDIF